MSRFWRQAYHLTILAKEDAYGLSVHTGDCLRAARPQTRPRKPSRLRGEGVVASASGVSCSLTVVSDSPTRVLNLLAIWPSAFRTSSFLAACTCSSARISPVRQSSARNPNTYWLQSLAIEPSRTAALPWVFIYERVSAYLPDFSSDRKPNGMTGRGKEKKQRLLTYLRDHPEELRPACL